MRSERAGCSACVSNERMRMRALRNALLASRYGTVRSERAERTYCTGTHVAMVVVVVVVVAFFQSFRKQQQR